MEAWKPIVMAEHDRGGVFFCQLWNSDRVSHTSYQPNGTAPMSSTNWAIPEGQVYLPTADGAADFSTPRALETEEVAQFVEPFRKAARNAMAAGFDGVEIHGAHGYLIDQFLKSSINDRTDRYGGSMENRCRFMVKVVEAVPGRSARTAWASASPPSRTSRTRRTRTPNGLSVFVAQ